ncbi:hypothetical protein RJT34_29648 [Clitoria ternatea]|uniref:Uncharacterized protein n=1 Tax=Clitoria ternatea TaxID=43366 RepID=A0AAN9HZP7_CLITE
MGRVASGLPLFSTATNTEVDPRPSKKQRVQGESSLARVERLKGVSSWMKPSRDMPSRRPLSWKRVWFVIAGHPKHGFTDFIFSFSSLLVFLSSSLPSFNFNEETR